jgi:O-methyltransferase involved in polyketide biosynthesis
MSLWSVKMSQIRLPPDLSGVEETMLWSLYERAYAAARSDGPLRDEHCVRIYNSIDYDFQGNFGIPSEHAPVRAQKIDQVLRQWLSVHPSGFIVSLGEGLETQAYRVDNGTMRWLSVDLPDAIRMRERFIRPTERFRHLAMSALEPAWMDHVDDRFGVFIIAQGLLMYFSPAAVRELLGAIAKRFPGGEMMFDLVPRVLSESTSQGHKVTATWTSPAMPWGLDRNEATSTLRSWLPELKKVNVSRYRPRSGRSAVVEDILDAVLPRRQRLPSLVHICL